MKPIASAQAFYNSQKNIDIIVLFLLKNAEKADLHIFITEFIKIQASSDEVSEAVIRSMRKRVAPCPFGLKESGRAYLETLISSLWGRYERRIAECIVEE